MAFESTKLESCKFWRCFVEELKEVDKLCTSEESKYDRNIAKKRKDDADELSRLERGNDHVGDAVAERERALNVCKEKLEAVQRRDKGRQDEIYAKMSNLKLSGNASGAESLRAELFANKEQVKRERDAAWQEYLSACERIEQAFVSAQSEKNKIIGAKRAAQSKVFKEYETKLLEGKDKTINDKIVEFKKKFVPKTIKDDYEKIIRAEPLIEKYECKKGSDSIPESVRLGTLLYDLSALNIGTHATSLLEKDYPMLYNKGKLNIPYCTDFGDNFNYMFTVNSGDAKGRKILIDRACSLALRLFMAIPPNKVNFTFIDPIDLGHNFALFGRLVDADERTNKVINGKLWTTAAEIGERLRILAGHIADVAQRCLQGNKTIQQYNEEADQNAEPYQILMIMDFPGEFNENSLSLLEKIISTGPKCGVYTIIFQSGEQLAKKVSDSKLKLLINNIGSKTTLFSVMGKEIKLVIDGLSDRDIPLRIEPLLPENLLADFIVPKLKAGIKNKETKEIALIDLLPAKNDWFKENSSAKLEIPIGKSGSRDIQNLVFGTSAYHALIIGQTGSGKSSLLHTIIMSSIVRYSADELSIFLVDFKRGVEFKIYANHVLNAFRAVAIESEREFGGSVLEYIDKEQERRKNLFTQEDVSNLHDYRTKTKKLLPRILLIIDEFQVLFSKDNDIVGKNAASYLTRTITQGRVFGIHVVLASQTMANIGGLHQALWGQVGIRIALKCPPSDAKLILSENNNGVELLAANEPGLAVYNSDCGHPDANKPFRVAYLRRDIQDELLTEISRRGPKPQSELFPKETRVMVSNIRDNLYHPYQKFLDSAVTDVFPDEFKERTVFIGEPLLLSGKLRSGFKPKDAFNMLIIGSDAKKARAMFAFSALSLSIHAIAQNGWKKPYGTSVHIMDFAPPEEDDEKERDVLLMLKERIPDYVKYEEFDDSIDILKKLHRNLPVAEGESGEERYLMIYGLQRARGLRRSVDPNSGQQNANAATVGVAAENASKPSDTSYRMFERLLKEGPAKNTHVIVWVDNFKTFQAHYPGLLDFFNLRVGFTMSDEDSVMFMEEPDGSQIGENNAVFSYNGNQKFRSYQMPNPEWLTEMCGRINSFRNENN